MKTEIKVALIGGGFAIVAALIPVAVTSNWFSPSPASPAPSPSVSSPGGPGNSNTGRSTPPLGSTSTGSAGVTNPVGITFSGIDFDSNPPGPGPNYINWQRYNYRLQGYGSSVIVSRYPSSGALPTEAACRNWALTHNSQILDGVNRGDRLCFITQDGRTVRFIVTNISSDAVEGQATVWNDSNQ